MSTSGIIVVPYVTKPSDEEWVWPQLQSGAIIGSAFQQNASVSGLAAANAAFWGAKQGVGADVMALYSGLYCADVTQPVIRAASATMPPLVTAAVPSLVQPSACRVTRISFAMAASGAPSAGGTGIALMTNTVTGWVTTGNFGFGIFGDGATWRFANYATALAFPNNLTEAVALAGLNVVTAWNMFEFQIINGADGRNASFTLVVNGNVALTRNWVSGTQLPALTNNFARLPLVYAAQDAGVNLKVGPVFISMGRFTRDGVELLA